MTRATSPGPAPATVERQAARPGGRPRSIFLRVRRRGGAHLRATNVASPGTPPRRGAPAPPSTPPRPRRQLDRLRRLHLLRDGVGRKLLLQAARSCRCTRTAAGRPTRWREPGFFGGELRLDGGDDTSTPGPAASPGACFTHDIRERRRRRQAGQHPPSAAQGSGLRWTARRYSKLTSQAASPDELALTVGAEHGTRSRRFNARPSPRRTGRTGRTAPPRGTRQAKRRPASVQAASALPAATSSSSASRRRLHRLHDQLHRLGGAGRKMILPGVDAGSPASVATAHSFVSGYCG
jgi:hypothetical protein